MKKEEKQEKRTGKWSKQTSDNEDSKSVCNVIKWFAVLVTSF